MTTGGIKSQSLRRLIKRSDSLVAKNIRSLPSIYTVGRLLVYLSVFVIRTGYRDTIIVPFLVYPS